jgi:hypothetical protein
MLEVDVGQSSIRPINASVLSKKKCLAVSTCPSRILGQDVLFESPWTGINQNFESII